MASDLLKAVERRSNGEKSIDDVWVIKMYLTKKQERREHRDRTWKQFVESITRVKQ